MITEFFKNTYEQKFSHYVRRITMLNQACLKDFGPVLTAPHQIFGPAPYC